MTPLRARSRREVPDQCAVEVCRRQESELASQSVARSPCLHHQCCRRKVCRRLDASFPLGIHGGSGEPYWTGAARQEVRQIREGIIGRKCVREVCVRRPGVASSGPRPIVAGYHLNEAQERLPAGERTFEEYAHYRDHPGTGPRREAMASPAAGLHSPNPRSSPKQPPIIMSPRGAAK